MPELEWRTVMTGYVKAEDMAVRWNVSVRQVQLMCQNGKIKDASKFGNVWAIPENTPKPTRTGKLKPGRKPKTSKSFHEQGECKHEV